MPRFEVSLPEMEPNVPWYCVSTRWAEWALTRSLHKTLQPELDDAFVRYSRSLDAWARRALSDLQTRFSTQADGFRAQLARLTTEQVLSTEERSHIEADLARIEGFTTIERTADRAQNLAALRAAGAGGEDPRATEAPRPRSN